MTVDDAMVRISSSGFLEWKVFLEMEWQERKPEHFYLAQIAQAVRQVLAKHPNRIKLDHFLLKFKDPKKGKGKSAISDLDERTQNSKNFWLGLTSMAQKPPAKKGKG